MLDDDGAENAAELEADGDKEADRPFAPRIDDGVMVKNVTVAPENYMGACRRPLGECELGMCCDICWYRPDHPRHKEKQLEEEET